MLRFPAGPAIRLMNRLRYPGKLGLLAGIFLLVIAVLMFSLYLSLKQSIDSSRKELAGLPLIRQFTVTIQLLQQYRGLSAGALAGSTSLERLRAAKEVETDRAVRDLAAALPPTLAQGRTWRMIERDWSSLRQNGKQLGTEKNFRMQTELIGRLLNFEVTAADEYALTLDPEYSSAYLLDTSIQKLPQVLERLGQLRAYGLIALASGKLSRQQQFAIHALTGELAGWRVLLADNAEKIVRHAPSLQAQVTETLAGIDSSTQRITRLVDAGALTTPTATGPEDFYQTSTEAINDGYARLHDALLSKTGALIEARLERAWQLLRINLGFALLLVLIAVYFFAGIYYSIVTSVRTLGESARHFADGDLHKRVSLESNDELKELGVSFNKVAQSVEQMALQLRSHNQQLEQKVAERTQSLGLMASVFQHSNVAMIITDGENRIISVNPAFTDLSGYEAAEVIGKNPKIFASGNTPRETYQDMWSSLATDGFWQGELWDRHRQGHVYPKWISITKVRDPDGRPLNYIASFTDLTEHHKKDMLMKQQARLATMGEMISNIAHQWRQPINSLGLILADLEDAAQHGECDTEYLHNATETARLLIQNMSSTIDDFKNFFKHDNTPANFNMIQTVQESLNIMHSALSHHHILVITQFSRDPVVFGRANDFSQCVINLLVNAKDAIVARNVAEGKITIGVSENEQYGILSVADNGGGIPTDVMPKIFEPYFTTKATGTGIGLYMSHMTIEKHMNGLIRVENLDGGACFTIMIPKTAPAQASPAE